MGAAVMAAALLAAVTTSAALAGSITIREWLPSAPGGSDFLKLASDAFGKVHPEITVVIKEFPAERYKTIVQAALAGGDPPDVFVSWSGQDIRELVRRHLVLDLSDLGKQPDGFLTELTPGWLSGFQFAGKYYGVPISGLSKYFYYNKTYFALNKLKLPGNFDELVGLCKAIRGIDPKTVPLPLGNSERWKLVHYVTMLNERIMGLDVITKDYDLSNPDEQLFTDPGYVDAWNRIAALAKAGCFQEDPNGTSPEASRTMFASQQSPMIYCGTWCAPIFDQAGFTDYALFRMPPVAGGKGDAKANFLVEQGLVVAVGTKHPREAAAWASFLVSDEIAERLADKEGVIPSNPKLIAGVANATEQFKWMAADTASFSKAITALDVVLEEPVAEAYLDAGTAVLNGSMTPVDAMKKIHDAAVAAKKALGK
jgi:raffinose/stachyose/melibiose transport system substrate-binding protein